MKLDILLVPFLTVLFSCQNFSKTSPERSGSEQVGVQTIAAGNGSMRNLKAYLIDLGPYIFDKDKFNDVENEAILIKEIHGLAVESANVKHDPAMMAKDPTVKFVSGEFAEELLQADKNFRGGWKDYSRSQLMKVTSYCIECHTRVRQGPEFQTDTKLSYVSNLSPRNQIELHIAFREFDKAYALSLSSLRSESTFIQKDSDIYAVARLGLLVAVRFQNNIDKAKLLLSTIDKNKSAPAYLKLDAKRWKVSVNRWSPTTRLNTLVEIRRLKRLRLTEIEDMRIIAALLPLLGQDLSDEELGEGLFLAGESYELLDAISALSLQDNYYEACVRQVPHTTWGKKCFSNLENSVKTSYTGTANLGLPVDVKKKLDTLKKKLE